MFLDRVERIWQVGIIFCRQQPLPSLYRIALVACCCSFMVLFNVAQAQQTKFSAVAQSQETTFSYQWTQQDKTFNLQFDIPNAALLNMPDSPAAYSNELFQEAVYSQVMQEAKQIDPRLANIDIRKKNDGLSFNVRSKKAGDAKLVLSQLSLAHEKAQNDFYTNNLFVKYKTSRGENGIRHDHAQYTKLSHSALAPIVEAIKQIQQQPNNPREFIDIALGWIQSIPYDRLENRLSSNGSGFMSPRDLLLQNKGDCDSKSTLMAALLRAYSANINLEMVYLSNHALLGVAMRALPKDQTISKKGMSYVLLEPTGPAFLKLGEVAETTKMALRNRQFDSTAL